MNKVKRNRLPLCLKCMNLIQIESLSFNKQYDLLINYKCGCNDLKTVVFNTYYSCLNYIYTIHSERCSVCNKYSSSLFDMSIKLLKRITLINW